MDAHHPANVDDGVELRRHRSTPKHRDPETWARRVADQQDTATPRPGARRVAEKLGPCVRRCANGSSGVAQANDSFITKLSRIIDLICLDCVSYASPVVSYALPAVLPVVSYAWPVLLRLEPTSLTPCVVSLTPGLVRPAWCLLRHAWCLILVSLMRDPWISSLMHDHWIS